VSPNCVKSGMGKHKHKKADEERNEGGVQEDEVQEAKEADTSQLQSETTKPYEELVTLMAPIAKPLASKKLTRKLYKAVRKAQKAKRLKRGVREVVKGLRKDEKGVVILAGDVSPIDVISHIPVFCEEKEVPYCYVPSRKDLGSAGGTKRPTSVVLIQTSDQYKDLYEECHSAVDALPLPI